MAAESKKLVLLALVANSLIAVTKFVAAAISGSSAMLSEGIHSVADSGNQLFLLRGHAASRFEPSVQHPYGRGKELYFWSFMVAVFLFVGGSVLSIVSGVNKIRHPHEHGAEGFWLSLGVLAMAAFFEGVVAFRPALKEFNRQRAGRTITKTVKESKDPSLLVVLFEDSAAMVGLFIAAVGLTATQVTGDGVWDGVASVLIGLLLAGVAWVLAVEMKSLLIGESATREERARIRAAVLSVGEARSVDRLLTMQLAPDEILVTLDVEFDDNLDSERIESAIVAMEGKIVDAVPEATRIFIEPVDR
ncbi:MAG: cation diffusion facilitator family transporter [Actinomycetota bacterium]